MVGQTDDRDFEVQTEAYLRTLGQKYMQDWPDDLEVAHGQGVVQVGRARDQTLAQLG